MVPNGQPLKCIRPYYGHLTTVNELSQGRTLSAIASGSAKIPCGSSQRWLVYETRTPDIEISPSVRPPLGLLLLVCFSDACEPH